MLRSTIAGFALAVATLSCLARAGAQADDQYWRWGWGLYGLLGPSQALDNARFDWTFVLFGSDAPEDEVVLRAKEVLQINPNHRFVLRVWPIMQLGKLPNNRFQATLFDYLYGPGVREQILARARRQVRTFMDAVGEESVAGATFLEELPSHFTSAPFGAEWRKWKRGDSLPWDMEPFKHRIAAELGAPFDLHNRAHRRWWGRRYSAAIAEILGAIREGLRGKPVFYYQHSQVTLLGDRPSAAGDDDSLDDAAVMPLRYQDVVGRGRADGLFVYPTSRSAWNARLETARRLGAMVFSQVSLPSSMRGTTLGDMVSLAQTRSAENLGSFLFPTIGDPLRERAYPDRSYRFRSDLIRRFAWDNRIHPEIVDRQLSPIIEFQSDRDLAKAALGEPFRVRAYVWNPRDPSWYGGDYAPAALRGAAIELAVPPGFRIEGSINARRAIMPLGELGPQDGRAAEWSVSRAAVDNDAAVGSPLMVSLRTSDGRLFVASARRAASSPIHEIDRSGAAWIEFSKAETSCHSAVEIRPLDGAVDSPMLARKGLARIFYQGQVHPSTRLVMGPGLQGRIYAAEIFDEDARHMFPLPRNAQDTATIARSGHFYSAGYPRVRAGERYRIWLEGWTSSQESVRIAVQFSGSRKGHPALVTVEGTAGEMPRQPGTVMSNEIEVPAFDEGDARVSLHFFRLGSDGVLSLRAFSMRRTDLPAEGQDVSERIVGSMPCEAPSATVWTYYDRSPVVGGTRAGVAVRLLD